MELFSAQLFLHNGLEIAKILGGICAVGGNAFDQLHSDPVPLIVGIGQLNGFRNLTRLERVEQKEQVGVDFIGSEQRATVPGVHHQASLIFGFFTGGIAQHGVFKFQDPRRELRRNAVHFGAHFSQRQRVDFRRNQYVTGAEDLTAPIGDPKEMIAKIGFENGGEVADGRIKHCGFKLRYELAARDILVAASFVFAAGIFGVA